MLKDFCVIKHTRERLTARSSFPFSNLLLKKLSHMAENGLGQCSTKRFNTLLGFERAVNKLN